MDHFRLRGVFGLAAAVCVCALSASVLPLRARSAQDGQFDVVIRGGQLVDGTGAPARRADIGIRGDVIAVIGDLAKAIAKQTIDAPGLVVAPGFIDMHSHSDFTLLADGRGLSKVTQGVTTELLGEAGSAAPVLGPARGEMENTLGELNLSLDWTTFPQYFERLERQGISVNILSAEWRPGKCGLRLSGTRIGRLQPRNCGAWKRS